MTDENYAPSPSSDLEARNRRREGFAWIPGEYGRKEKEDAPKRRRNDLIVVGIICVFALFGQIGVSIATLVLVIRFIHRWRTDAWRR